MTTSARRNFALLRIRVSFFCVLGALCVSIHAQDFKTVHDGIEYAEVAYKIGDDPVKINLLRLDLTKVRLDVHHAMDAAIGTEKTSSIATRHGAVAAINAGFFRLDTSIFAGDAAGVLLIDGKLLSESTNDRIAMVIGNSKTYTSVFFNHVSAYADVQVGEGSDLIRFPLSGVNRERKKTEAVIYTSLFGTSPQTGENEVALSLSRCKIGKIIGSFRDYICGHVEMIKGSGKTKVPRNGFVISIGPEYLVGDKKTLLKINQLNQTNKKSRKIRIRNPILLDGGQFTVNKKIDITNGVPQLIKNGKIDITWEQEKSSKSFVETRHPRTAVAKLKDGKFLMITVDGRQPGVSVGMNLNELAAYLLELGAVNAMNLDGGGSTTMFLDGKVVNKPSDKEGERKISDTILVTLRKKPALKKN